MSHDILQMMDQWGPEKVVCVSDRRSGMRGVLVIDNTARGMGKGGTRMSPSLSINEVSRLARTMTWKWAAIDLFFGGAKAGILGDPTASGKEAVLRAFARRLSNEVPKEYVFGLDMGLSEPDVAIFIDELGDRGASAGLPSALGGLPYDELGVTGFGVAEAADSAAETIGLPMRGARVTIQGLGAVGIAAAKRFDELGAVVVAISTAKGTLHTPEGLDIDALAKLREKLGDDCVTGYSNKSLPVGAELRVPTDILVPSAREDMIDVNVAKSLDVKLVVEGANMPTTKEAKLVLHARGIPVVPDFIANAGGVVAAVYTMGSRYSPFRPDTEQVFSTVAEKMRHNAATVLLRAQSWSSTPYEAALRLAQERVLASMELRGQVTI